MFMSTSSVMMLIPWIILLYSSSHLSILQAEKCYPQKCGNMSIPYPFFFSKEKGSKCGLPGFEIICNTSVPFLKTPHVRISNFSDDHLLIKPTQLSASTCKNNLLAFEVPADGPFRIADSNKFITVGCNTYGEFSLYLGKGNASYTGSCASFCHDDNVTIASIPLGCNYNGCCEIPLPAGYTKYNLSADVYYYEDTNECRHFASAIVDKDSWDLISKSGKANFKDGNYSIRLDWAILHDTCDSAKNKNSSLCAPNSQCEDREWGYVCKCSTGYEGDGYFNGTSCTEIRQCIGLGDGAGICFQTIYIITALCVILVIMLLVGVLIWILKRRKWMVVKQKNFDKNGGALLQQLISSRGVEGIRLFSSEEIEKATKMFSQSLVLGSGGYGTVYKGTLTDKTVVAIKKSKEVDSKDIEQFINEVVILSQINHKNVVRLLGCCLETAVPLLVYEYISNGTLFDHLHGSKQKERHLLWEERLRIATGTAEALAYLHTAAAIPIVHRDVKSSNILLDDGYNPKVADFGVSRMVPMGQTHVITAVQGTIGYLDPEYFQSVQLTQKSDVYSFGVVLVELLTGLKPIMNDQSNLAKFFLSTLNASGPTEIIDPRLKAGEATNTDSMARVANLAKACLSVEGGKRPTMMEVVRELLSTESGTRPQALLDVYVAEETVALIGDDKLEDRSGGVSMVEPCSMPSVSFSIEAFNGVNSGR